MSQSITDAELLALGNQVWGEVVTHVELRVFAAEVWAKNEQLLSVVHLRPREALHAMLRALVNPDQQEKS